MGNYISCAFVPPLTKNARVTRVISPTGELKQFRDIVTAADLMLDNPTYFLVNSRSLHIGRRFYALSADDHLEFGCLYVFFPMRRVNSIVTAADMAALFLAANSAAKRISAAGKAQVQPENGGDERAINNNGGGGGGGGAPRLSLGGVEESFESYRLSFSRSRKPGLETINEEPMKDN